MHVSCSTIAPHVACRIVRANPFSKKVDGCADAPLALHIQKHPTFGRINDVTQLSLLTPACVQASLVSHGRLPMVIWSAIAASVWVRVLLPLRPPRKFLSETRQVDCSADKNT